LRQCLFLYTATDDDKIVPATLAAHDHGSDDVSLTPRHHADWSALPRVDLPMFGRPTRAIRTIRLSTFVISGSTKAAAEPRGQLILVMLHPLRLCATAARQTLHR
jgi:hypothetical protein